MNVEKPTNHDGYIVLGVDFALTDGKTFRITLDEGKVEFTELLQNSTEKTDG